MRGSRRAPGGESGRPAGGLGAPNGARRAPNGMRGQSGRGSEARRSSGACSRTMVREVPIGTEPGVAYETRTATRNAVGTVQAAGWARRAPSHPPPTELGPPRTVIVVAVRARTPPVTRPAVAPATDSRRHQTPRTSSGQNVDAATAKANPTVSARLVLTASQLAAYGTTTATTAASRKVRIRGTSPPARRPMVRARKSWSMTPATEMVSPDAVERNAANAPPASTADRTVPSTPGATRDARRRVT